ncbi:hypothetical protein CROQUDRAFT_50645 [Cronartium quercuum f. sp. fusiforme G11]|uniref:Uncharacterized protein n=1 Tax=Cronartium quercuum f. sp. fusiforme G11 TaxID=708437 RepID=A0A9P6NDT0_9BASI|nr:hypothetical protein CROQUDRAFT_50645 [Cronartium quercuum f. sp. fusiforme G11]
MGMIGVEDTQSLTVAQLQAEAEIPQNCSTENYSNHVSDARQLKTRPAPGKAHMVGEHTMTQVIIMAMFCKLVLDSGAACSIVGMKFLETIVPDWRDKLLPCSHMTFLACASALKPLGIIELPVIFPQMQGSVRMRPEFVVMENAMPQFFILGGEFLSLYGIDIYHSRESYFTIGNDNKKKKFTFIKKQMILNITHEHKEPAVHDRNKAQPSINPKVNIALERVMLGQNLSKTQENDMKDIIRKFHKAFALGDMEFGTVKNHEVEIKLTVEKPYPPILKKAVYPASPSRSRN